MFMPSSFFLNKTVFINSLNESISLINIPHHAAIPAGTYTIHKNGSQNDNGKLWATYWYGSGHDVDLTLNMLNHLHEMNILN